MLVWKIFYRNIRLLVCRDCLGWRKSFELKYCTVKRKKPG